MPNAPDDVRRSAQSRDAATLRLRRVTQLSVALMVALGGAFSALAAGSTHPKKTTVGVPARRVAPTAVLVRAPAPPLIGSQSAPPPSASEAPAAPVTPAPAPAPTYQQPVVVSGGS
jgi:hypothetical protein